MVPGLRPWLLFGSMERNRDLNHEKGFLGAWFLFLVERCGRASGISFTILSPSMYLWPCKRH